MGKLLLVTFLLFQTGISGRAAPHEFREHLNKEFQVQGNAAAKTLCVFNMSGFVKVEGYEGDKVIIDIDKVLSAGSEKSLETAKREFRMGYDLKGDSIVVYIASPFDTRPHRHCSCNYDRDDSDYDFKLDITIRVPSGMNLDLSTVNDGIISTTMVYGDLKLNNVNGGIKAEKAKGQTWAHTVNGDITISYLSNPQGSSSFYTINGDINTTFQNDLSADVEFKSMNGDFYTNFPGSSLLPGKVKKSEETKEGSKIFRLTSNTSFRFGNGGNPFSFETLNGNVFVKHI